jgi:hypothetical protein
MQITVISTHSSIPQTYLLTDINSTFVIPDIILTSQTINSSQNMIAYPFKLKKREDHRHSKADQGNAIAQLKIWFYASEW